MSNTLISFYSENSVAFVDNHDTQPGQSLESWVDNSFKLQSYTFILTRKEWVPCVFFGDYYGISNNDIAPLLYYSMVTNIVGRGGNLNKHAKVCCSICGNEKNIEEVIDVSKVGKSIADNIKKEFPELHSSGFVCTSCLNSYRREHITDSLQVEEGALSALDEELVGSIKDKKMQATEIYKKIDKESTKGDRIADIAAEFGGSWWFILIFSIIFIGWIIMNSVIFINRRFDPYPFSLLNLVLSCLAAIQAPIIMMSQNRQEVKDRKRSENEYQINLRAELKIQSVNEKLNYLSDLLAKLMETQQIQSEMITEFIEKQNDSFRQLETSQGEATKDIININS